MEIEGVRLVILFGSYVTGKMHTGSDIDVAVLGFHSLDFQTQGRVAEHIAGTLGVSEDAIDIVDVWDASPLLQYEVAKQGKLFLGSEFDFTRFKVLAWKRYLDTAKFRRAREKALRQKMHVH